jgi:hypothetical protein
MAVKAVKEAIGEMALSSPLIKVGTTLAKGGELVQRGYEKVKKEVGKRLPSSKPATTKKMGKK